MKRCPRCCTYKALEEFSCDCHKKDGRQTYCIACWKAKRLVTRKRNGETGRQWRKLNREKARASCRRYYRRHREAQLQRMKRWRSVKPDAAYKAVKSWRSRNKDKTAVYASNRLGRVRGAQGNFTPAQWKDCCQRYGNKCAYCGLERKLTVQHIVPVSRGGSNNIDNIAPACRPCNSRIHTKIVYPPLKAGVSS